MIRKFTEDEIAALKEIAKGKKLDEILRLFNPILEKNGRDKIKSLATLRRLLVRKGFYGSVKQYKPQFNPEEMKFMLRLVKVCKYIESVQEKFKDHFGYGLTKKRIKKFCSNYHIPRPKDRKPKAPPKRNVASFARNVTEAEKEYLRNVKPFTVFREMVEDFNKKFNRNLTRQQITKILYKQRIDLVLNYERGFNIAQKEWIKRNCRGKTAEQLTQELKEKFDLQHIKPSSVIAFLHKNNIPQYKEVDTYILYQDEKIVEMGSLNEIAKKTGKKKKELLSYSNQSANPSKNLKLQKTGEKTLEISKRRKRLKNGNRNQKKTKRKND